MSTATALVNPFQMTVASSEKCPPGNYSSVVVGLIDLGTHDAQFDDGTKGKSRKAAILVQIGDQFARQSNGKPFVFVKEVTISSFGTKSNIRKIAECLLGRTFASSESVDLTQLIGRHCMADIKHKPGAEGKVYANLNAITSLGFGTQPASPAMETVVWFHGMGEFPAIGSTLWNYGKPLKAIYQESDEYRAIHGGPAGGKDVIPQAEVVDPSDPNCPF